MRISKMADYALVVLSRLSAGSGVRAEAPRSARGLAEETKLPLPTVARVLKTLGKAKLVEAERGVAGGYRLSRDLAHISLASVLSAFDDGRLGLTECAHAGSVCFLQEKCPTKPGWGRVNRLVMRTLEGVTLDEFLAERFGQETQPSPILTHR